MTVEKSQVLFVPKTKAEAVKWLELCVWFCGGGFHPDTPGDDYINEDDRPTFTKAEIKLFEKARNAVFTILPDPYKVGLKFMDKLISTRA